MSISILFVPFSCLTGATPFTGDELFLPLTKGCCCWCDGGGDEDNDVGSSSNSVFDASDDTSLMLLSGCDDGGLLLLTNAAVFWGDAGDEGGDFATSSSTLHTQFSVHTKIISYTQTVLDIKYNYVWSILNAIGANCLKLLKEYLSTKQN